MTSILPSNALEIKSEIDEVPVITEKFCWLDNQNIKHEEEADFEINGEEVDNNSPSKRQSLSRNLFHHINSDNSDDDISIKSYGNYSSEDCQANTEIMDEKYLSGINYLRLITVKERKPIDAKIRRIKSEKMVMKDVAKNKIGNGNLKLEKNSRNENKITSKNLKRYESRKVQNGEIKKKLVKISNEVKKNLKTIDQNDSTTSKKQEIISNKSTTSSTSKSITKTIKTFRRIMPTFNSKINQTSKESNFVKKEKSIEISKCVKRKRDFDEKITQENKKESKTSTKPETNSERTKNDSSTVAPSKKYVEVDLNSKSEKIPVNSKISNQVASSAKLQIKKLKNTKFQCKICSKFFTSRAYLERHSKTHKPRIKFKCDQCDAEFQIKRCFLRHVCNICRICDRKFAKKDYFMLHMKAKHVDPSEIKLFSCDVCGKTFKHKRIVKTHILSKHLKNMEIFCKICNRIFTDPRPLVRHMRSHQERIPCQICRSFLKPMNMLSHIKTVHTDIRNYKCPKCPKSFKSSSELTVHMIGHVER